MRTVAQTASDQDSQRAQIEADRARGSFRHRRLPSTLRRVPALVFGADGLLLLYFFSGVTNVDWASPFSAALVFAVLLASMVTGISFAFFRFTGDRLQQYKDDAGVIPLRGLDQATTVSMGLALGAMIVLAALMFIRMRAEVLSTLGPASGGTAIIISAALAVVSILANSLVIAVHALDGSAEADRLEALGQAVSPQLTLKQRLLERAEALDPRIDIIGREAERVAFEGRTAAGIELAAADRVHRRRPRRQPGHRPDQRTRHQSQRRADRHRLPPYRRQPPGRRAPGPARPRSRPHIPPRRAARSGTGRILAPSPEDRPNPATAPTWMGPRLDLSGDHPGGWPEVCRSKMGLRGRSGVTRRSGIR